MFWETTYFLLIINIRQCFEKSLEETLQTVNSDDPGEGHEIWGVWSKNWGKYILVYYWSFV